MRISVSFCLVQMLRGSFIDSELGSKTSIFTRLQNKYRLTVGRLDYDTSFPAWDKTIQDPYTNEVLTNRIDASVALNPNNSVYLGCLDNRAANFEYTYDIPTLIQNDDGKYETDPYETGDIGGGVCLANYKNHVGDSVGGILQFTEQSLVNNHAQIAQTLLTNVQNAWTSRSFPDAGACFTWCGSMGYPYSSFGYASILTR